MINCYELLNATRKNKEGQIYYLFDCEKNREMFLDFLVDCLNVFLTKINTIASDSKKELILQHFEETIKSVSSIRIDEKDKDKFPVKLIYDDFTKHGKIPFKNKLKDGVTRSVLEDGIMMLLPEMQEEIKNPNNINARHTFIHEILHAMSNSKVIQDGKATYISGMQLYGNNNIFDDLNEGLNEYFAAGIIKLMYPNNRVEQRYKARVKVIQALMSKFDFVTQKEIFENYLLGNFSKVYDKYFSELKSVNGENFLDGLQTLRAKNFRITESTDDINMEKSQVLISALQKFNIQKNKENQAFENLEV